MFPVVIQPVDICVDDGGKLAKVAAKSVTDGHEHDVPAEQNPEVNSHIPVLGFLLYQQAADGLKQEEETH
jgi:hypothetical protein